MKPALILCIENRNDALTETGHLNNPLRSLKFLLNTCENDMKRQEYAPIADRNDVALQEMAEISYRRKRRNGPARDTSHLNKWRRHFMCVDIKKQACRWRMSLVRET